jgi:hypothetical protein
VEAGLVAVAPPSYGEAVDSISPGDPRAPGRARL